LALVEATKFHYKLRGICQSAIVEASDGHLYVLKTGGKHLPNLLLNESFGRELLGHFGLPGPQWRAVLTTDEFIDSHPDSWFETERRRLRPAAGPHFGTRLITSKGAAGAFQVIPSSWVTRVRNRQDFAGMLALDIWANHCDRRQAVYTIAGDGLQATFIDNGEMFGGSHGRDLTCPRRTMAQDLRIYHGLPVKDLLEDWRKNILGTNEQLLRSLLGRVPEGWCTNEGAERVLSSLLLRRHKLASLFSEAVERLEGSKTTHTDELLTSIAARA
jgi:hypothetical protein